MSKVEPSAPSLEERDTFFSLTHEVHQDVPYAIHVDEIQPALSIQYVAPIEPNSVEPPMDLNSTEEQEYFRNDGVALSQANENKVESSLRHCDGIKRGEWEVGLYSCFRHCVPNCWMSMFCPYISIAQIISRLGVLSYAVALMIMLTIGFIHGATATYNISTYSNSFDHSRIQESYGINFIDYVARVSWLILIVIIWQLRTNVRERFELPGSCFGDFVIVIFCSPCVVCQIATHVKSYKPGTCDFGPQDTLPAYSCN